MKEIVSFYLNGRKYGVEMSHMNAIENYSDMIKMPDMPDFLQGFVNIRGEMMPVVNLQRFLSQPSARVSEETKYILLRTPKGSFASLIDKVSDLLKIEDNYVMTMPALTSSDKTDYVDFVAKSGQDLILTLDPNRFLGEQEWKVINEIRDNMEAQDD